MKVTNIGVQLMPLVLLICSVLFYALDAKIYAAFCFVLAMLFAFVLMSENLSNKK